MQQTRLETIPPGINGYFLNAEFAVHSGFGCTSLSKGSQDLERSSWGALIASIKNRQSDELLRDQQKLGQMPATWA
ncbi:MAG: hypothetical protein CMN98_02160 [Synechococcus sp. NP17]|nr:hypothetical protein [Synechococcus sp. NP17]